MTIVGCETAKSPARATTQTATVAASQQTFPSAKAAAEALVDAVQRGDDARTHEIFGPAYQDMLTGNHDQDARNLRNFAGRTREGWKVVESSPTAAKILIGARQREFPIPLIADSRGQWRFDTATGVKVIRAHRIDRNEMETARVCLAYVEAQKEFATLNRDSAGLIKYAEHIKSTDSKKDGLYWAPEPNQAPSPMGPLVAAAEVDTTPNLIGPPTTRPAGTFHGYQFRILKRQGSNAPGGAYSYVIHGNLVGGYALVAWPATYGQTGVYTFIINQNGKLYQKDLGQKTAEAAAAMSEFNPDSTWTAIEPPPQE